MAFDMSQVQRGARNRRTPYHEAAQKHDPKGYTVYNHMYFPIRFDSFEAEFDALLNGVTLWDVAVERCLEIGGPDGFRFAQLLTPRDLSKCAVGQAKYVLICDSDGGIINDPVMTRMDENTFWFALASSDALLFARGLRNAYPGLDVTIREADVAPLQVQGPKSKDVMSKLVGPEILDLQLLLLDRVEDRRRAGGDHADGLDLRGRVRGVPDRHEQGRRGLRGDHGRRRRVRHRPDGPERHQADRGRDLQLGRGHDLREQPDRAGSGPPDRLGPRERCGHLDGRPGSIQERGVERRINGLEMDGDPFPELNNVKWPIVDGGREIGKVTSAIYSPRLERNIGFAWLPVERSTLGERVTVETEWGARTGTVVEMPFVDPSKQIPVS